MKALGIVGWKKSGKTYLITRLIPALKARGLSVSTIKHVHHDIDLDSPGKDTFAHREAGAVDVLILSDSRWALLHERRGEPGPEPELSDLLRHMSPVDLVLVEGLKALPIPKIEIRTGDAPPIEDGKVIAVVTDEVEPTDLQTFRRNDIQSLADFVFEKIAKKEADFASGKASAGTGAQDV